MVQLYHNRNVNKNSLLFKVDYTSERTTSKQTTTLLLYIVSNVFYILGMAHRVHYATRIDWTQRKLHSNAVFWHSLAPE